VRFNAKTASNFCALTTTMASATQVLMDILEI
jgi:hypothetical protein